MAVDLGNGIVFLNTPFHPPWNEKIHFETSPGNRERSLARFTANACTCLSIEIVVVVVVAVVRVALRRRKRKVLPGTHHTHALAFVDRHIASFRHIKSFILQYDCNDAAIPSCPSSVSGCSSRYHREGFRLVQYNRLCILNKASI